jgi:predicted nucleic-acid-binding Zn-ribbon protein
MSYGYVKCTKCGWRGDDYENQTARKQEVIAGVMTEVWTCPECGNDDFELIPLAPDVIGVDPTKLPPAAKAAPLTEKQRRTIRAGINYLGFDDAVYRGMLAQYPRETTPRHGDAVQIGQACSSSSHLSRRQGRLLIADLQLAGFPLAKPYSGSRKRVQATEAAGATSLPTPAQTAIIRRLREDIDWRHDDGYERWLSGRYSPIRSSSGQIQTYGEAEAVIEALKHMRKAEAPANVSADD